MIIYQCIIHFYLFIYLLIYRLFNDALSDSDHKSRLLRCYSVIKKEVFKKKSVWLNWNSYSATCVRRLRKTMKDLNQYWQYTLQDSSLFPGIKDVNVISWGNILGFKYFKHYNNNVTVYTVILVQANFSLCIIKKKNTVIYQYVGVEKVCNWTLY